MVLSFVRNLSDKYGEKFLDAAIKTRLDTGKCASKNVIYKTAEATEELIGSKILKKKNWNNWKNSETKFWSIFEKDWRNSYSTRENTGNTNDLRQVLNNRTLQSV